MGRDDRDGGRRIKPHRFVWYDKAAGIAKRREPLSAGDQYWCAYCGWTTTVALGAPPAGLQHAPGCRHRRKA